MSPAISVIVPVYNVEDYLEQCVESLLSQKKENIEIILIDDGSLDRSGEMCDEYRKKDNRIKVIHQKNGGLSAARNSGLDCANGQYVMFVDSDDWVEPDFCGKPFEEALINDADLVLFKYVWVEQGRYEQQPDFKSGIKTENEAMHMVHDGAGICVWNKLYKKDLFDGIRFPNGRQYEDMAVTVKIIHKAARIYYSNEPLYYYRGRDDSISKTISHKGCKDLYEMSLEKSSLLTQYGYKALADGSMRWACWTYLVREGSKSEHSAECLKFMHDYDKRTEGFPLSKRIMYAMLVNVPWLFDWICTIKGRRAKR